MTAPAFAPTLAGPYSRLAPIRSMLGEINDLKRIRVAGRVGSLAEVGFARSWEALIAGQVPERVARREAAWSVASARLGGIDAATLTEAGLGRGEVEAILRASIVEISRPLGSDWLASIEPMIAELANPSNGTTRHLLPEFVARLQAQPRAGATRPGRPRLILEPPENHAEHCYITAVYAVLVSFLLEADPGIAFLAGLSHHFHNAYLPDSGFAGEELLGDHLAPIMEEFSLRSIGQLPEALVPLVLEARMVLKDAETPEGRAFHAGDVFDRVLQMEQYSRVAAFETRQALEDLDLVHPGPLQAFHREVLSAVGLLP